MSNIYNDAELKIADEIIVLVESDSDAGGELYCPDRHEIAAILTAHRAPDNIAEIIKAAKQVAESAHEIDFPSMPSKALVGKVEIQNLVNMLARFEASK